MESRDRALFGSLEKRLAVLEGIVEQLKPLAAHADALAALLEDREFRARVSGRRAALWGRAGRVLAALGAAVVLLESCLQLAGVR